MATPISARPLVAPQRSVSIILNGRPTMRFAEFLEQLAIKVNASYKPTSGGSEMEFTMGWVSRFINDIKFLQSEVDSLKARVTTLESKVTTLEAEYEDLDNQVLLGTVAIGYP